LSVTPIVCRTWIRITRRNSGFAVAYFLLTAWLVVMLAAVIGEFARGPAAVWLPLGVLLLAMAVLSVRLAYGWAWAGLLVGADEIVVRGPWRTRRIARPWAERFDAGLQRTSVGNPTPGILLRLGDGSTVNVAALATESMVWSSERKVARWTATAAALNELLPKDRN
jgi:hypothetical protein